jgi:hypothetical protein
VRQLEGPSPALIPSAFSQHLPEEPLWSAKKLCATRFLAHATSLPYHILSILKSDGVFTNHNSQRVAPFGSQEGTCVMMVLSYWEQACAFLNHGLVHEQLFFETSGEFFGVWERVKPVVPKMREMFRQNLFLANLEKAAQRFEKHMEAASPGALEAMRQWTQQMRSAKAQEASA